MNEQRIIDEMRAAIGKLKSDVRFEMGMSLLTFGPLALFFILFLFLFPGCSRLHDRLDDIESEVRTLKQNLPTDVASEDSVKELDRKVEQSAASVNASIEALGTRTQMALDRLAR